LKCHNLNYPNFFISKIILAQSRSEQVQVPSSSYGTPGVDASVENTNSIYAQDGGYASGRPSADAPTFSSSVPETIQQSYDSEGGYQY
jgi:hypothetical protein